MLEVMLAFALAVLAITAAASAAAGIQLAVLFGQKQNQAMALAQSALEQARVLSLADFSQLQSRPAGPAEDGLVASLDVADIDYFSKQVVSRVSWSDRSGLKQEIALPALFTDYPSAKSTDTCQPLLSGDWRHPVIVNFSLADLLNNPAGTYTVAGLDVYAGKLYAVLAASAGKTAPTFLIFDLANPALLKLAAAVDNAPSTSAGPAAVQVAGRYAYLANGYGPNFNSCQQGPACGQLQIMDLGGSAPQLVSSFKVPGAYGSGGQAAGASLAYRDGLVYLGLAKTANATGTEFNVISVGDPASPGWLGGSSIGSVVNALALQSHYAYLATPNNNLTPANDEELSILDIGNPAAPIRVGGFAGSDNQGHGKSLAFYQGRIFFGRTQTNTQNPELYVLANKDWPSLQAIAGQKIGSSVNGLMVRSGLAFLATTAGQFQIWDFSGSSPVRWDEQAVSLPGNGTGLDCEGNTFYAASNDAAGRGFISVINAQ